MKRVVATTVILLAGAASALAQTSPSQPATPATPQASPAAPSSDTLKNTDVPKTPAAPSMPPSSADKSGLGGPTAGANSFTENQAKTRLESSGFSNVSGLKKDDVLLQIKDKSFVPVWVDPGKNFLCFPTDVPSLPDKPTFK